jgi:MFS family permease
VTGHGEGAASGAAGVRRWRNAVMAAFALGGVTLATWGPRLSGIRADLRLGDGGVGLVLAGVTIGSVAGLVASSALLSRFGSRRAVCGTLWLVAVGVAAVGGGAGVLRSVGVTVAGFVVIGFGVGAVDVLINVEGAAVERAAGRTLMPLMHAAWSAGAIIGSALGAASAALGIAYAWQFLGEAVVIVVVAALAAASLPPGVRAEEQAAPAPVRERVRGWLQGWTDGRLLLIGLVMLGVELGEGTANNWLTLAVRDGHHQPEAVAALFFTAFAVGETLARVAGGPLVDRVGRVRAVRGTTALGMAGLLLFILGAHPALVLVGTLLWAVGVSMGFPLGMSAAADSGPDPAARVSVVASIGYLANLGGPPVIGFLSESFGLLDALFAVIVLLALGFAVAGALRARRADEVPART